MNIINYQLYLISSGNIINYHQTLFFNRPRLRFVKLRLGVFLTGPLVVSEFDWPVVRTRPRRCITPRASLRAPHTCLSAHYLQGSWYSLVTLKVDFHGFSLSFMDFPWVDGWDSHNSCNFTPDYDQAFVTECLFTSVSLLFTDSHQFSLVTTQITNVNQQPSAPSTVNRRHVSRQWLGHCLQSMGVWLH